MSDSSDMSANSTPPDIRQEANETYDTLLSSKSKSKYETCYKKFMDWTLVNGIKNISENVLTAYTKLCSFLKLKSIGYKTKKSKNLTPEQIKHFLLKAPNREYPFTKDLEMVIKCLICKAPFKKGENRSYHRIPKKLERKRKWLLAIGKDFVIRNTHICSDHFVKSDFILKPSGVKYLKHYYLNIENIDHT
ncbi:hypothetical protein NQ317_002517 [Molorchus minor]|uniref:THAP-type domain-containing protein n=1 Tax=Molorchus minor TaxID=1323400 RepID=A0ABQ9J9L2_9CUCU|nr:hypothetical protein NQ317_002517 [Molorchus minor]